MNYLFQGVSVFDVSKSLSEYALRSMRDLSEDELLSTDPEELVERAVDACTIDFPELLTDDVYVEEREEQAQVSAGYDARMYGYPANRTVTRHVVSFHLPFNGNRDAFNYGPSQRSLPGPMAGVLSNELLIEVDANQRSSSEIKGAFNAVVASIREHLDRMRRDLESLPKHIEQPARDIVTARRSTLLKNKNTVAELGFPIKRRGDAPQTYRAPVKRRELAPKARLSTSSPKKTDPVLDETEYQNILNIMDNMTKVIERSPRAFEKMAEEDLRQHFLVQLNGQYEGQASGETFNCQGKTDILIRAEGRNIFIAECKFWKGKESFQRTIDQLMGYLSWRDTKAAVLVFNQNKNLSTVLRTISETLKGHPLAKTAPKQEGATRFRCTMASASDKQRDIVLSVLVYDMPVATA